MTQVSVLVVVDVTGALAHGLSGNLYMIDTTGYLGSFGEGGNELMTVCTDGQIVNWTVAPVDPETNLAITQFSGQMVSDNICNPQLVNAPGGSYWSGRVESQGQTTRQQYTMSLSLQGGSPVSFDPFLQINAAP